MNYIYTSLFMIFLVGCSSNDIVTPNTLEHKGNSVESTKLYLDYQKKLLEKDRSNTTFNNPSIQPANINFYETNEDIISIGDIITVKVVENVSSQKKSEKTLAKNDTSDYGTGVGITTPSSSAAFGGAGGAVANFVDKNINPIADIKFSTAKSSSFGGNGESKSEETFETTISVFVIEQLNNHLFFISGERKRYINGQYTYEKLTGIISDKNINDLNEITSDKIANLEITYKPIGDINENTEQNLPSRLINKILF